MELLGFCYIGLSAMVAVAIIHKSYITNQDPDEVLDGFLTEIFKFF